MTGAEVLGTEPERTIWERAVLDRILTNVPDQRPDGGDLTPDWISTITTAMIQTRDEATPHPYDTCTDPACWSADVRHYHRGHPDKVAILPGDPPPEPESRIPTNLTEAAAWLATSATNAEKNYPGQHTLEFIRGYRCAAGWVKSWAERP